ncbi:MAG: hypothetical protein ACLQGJ_02660 [Candidatus Dormibacteria bacterium]
MPVVAAQEVQTWFDPPLQPYLSPRSVNWWAAVVDPVTKLPLALPSGGSIVFQWRQPGSSFTSVTSATISTGIYECLFQITPAMVGKLILNVAVLDSSGNTVGQNTAILVVYPAS